MVIGVLMLTVFITGRFGLGGSGLCPAAIAANIGIKDIVFAAAPLSSIRIWPSNLGLTNRTAPPEYRIVSLLNVHPSQSSPSRGCDPFRKPIFTTGRASPGMLGSLWSPNVTQPGTPAQSMVPPEIPGGFWDGDVGDCARATV